MQPTTVATVTTAPISVPPVSNEENQPVDPGPIAAPAIPAPLPSTSAIEPPSAPPPEPDLKQRISAAIAEEEAQQERLLSAASEVEQRIALLKAILPFAEKDQAIEDTLRGVLRKPRAAEPGPAQSQPSRVLSPAPPQQIVNRFQVSRDLVLAAVQTFDDTFTLNDLLALMTNGAHLDPSERTRVRASIASCLMQLYERGHVTRESEHFGRTQATWRKAGAKNAKAAPTKPGARRN